MNINNRQLLVLKKEADEFEKELKLSRDCQMILVRAKLKKEHLYWTRYLDSRVVSQGLANNCSRPSSRSRSTVSTSCSQKSFGRPSARPTPTRLVTHHRVYTPLVLYTNRQTPRLYEENDKSGDISSMMSSAIVLKTSLPPSRETKVRPTESGAKETTIPEIVANEVPATNSTQESVKSVEGINDASTDATEDTDLTLDLTKLDTVYDDDDIRDTGDTNDTTNEVDILDTNDTTDIVDTVDTIDDVENDDPILAEESLKKVHFSLPDVTMN